MGEFIVCSSMVIFSCDTWNAYIPGFNGKKYVIQKHHLFPFLSINAFEIFPCFRNPRGHIIGRNTESSSITLLVYGQKQCNDAHGDSFSALCFLMIHKLNPFVVVGGNPLSLGGGRSLVIL